MSSFDNFIKEIEQEAEEEGPAAVAQLKDLRSQYRLARDILDLRKVGDDAATNRIVI